MRILKFGGTSLATPERIRRVAAIVAAAREEEPIVVVVSAFGGVTNELLRALELAAGRDVEWENAFESLRDRHLAAAQELGGADLVRRLDERLGDLRDLLHGIWLLREASPRTRDAVLSYGERTSAEVVAAALVAAGTPARAVDARRVIVSDASFGRARVDLEATQEQARCELADTGSVAVVTGFIAASPEGQTTTLGRGGSDSTAAILGACLDASVVELWTDVDGVMSADPRCVDEAFVLPRLSYAELMELSHFGAKVVHPPSVHPARSRGIPLVIRNTLRPEAPGTRVEHEAPPGEHPIRGIASIPRVALLRLEGDGMVGVPGIAGRLFGALARCRVSVILISQGSSEHSICFAVAPEDTEAVRRAVAEEFALELRLGIVDELVVEPDHAVVAAVGEQMRERTGIAARLFGILGRSGINVRAIAQGSSELNISIVVARSDERAALRAVHRAFFRPRQRRIDIALAGVGRVGSALLDQVRETAEALESAEELEIRVVALLDSRRMVLDRGGIDLESWSERLADGEPQDPDRLRRLLSRPSGGRSVFVDCTASAVPGAWYLDLLRAGVPVVGANKVPLSSPGSAWKSLRDRALRGTGLWGEATVGAGLPILGTLRDLVRTGDRVERIEGVLSGTLNAVCERMTDGEDLSDAVRAAHVAGLTEPHPVDDLTGTDVARKLLILARLAGWELEPDDIVVEPLLPEDPWRSLSLEELWERLPEQDAAFRERRDDARSRGERLRYLAVLDGDGARVRLGSVPPEHPAAVLAGADNLVAFTTARYRSPLVVRGPGAGPEVTAAGVFADVLRAGASRSAG